MRLVSQALLANSQRQHKPIDVQHKSKFGLLLNFKLPLTLLRFRLLLIQNVSLVNLVRAASWLSKHSINVNKYISLYIYTYTGASLNHFDASSVLDRQAGSCVRSRAVSGLLSERAACSFQGAACLECTTLESWLAICT